MLEGLLVKIGFFYCCMGQHRVASQFVWSPVLKCPILTVQLAVFEGKEGREAGDSPLLSQAARHCSFLRPCYNLLTTLKMSQIAPQSSDLWVKPSYNNNWLAVSVVTSGFNSCSSVSSPNADK